MSQCHFLLPPGPGIMVYLNYGIHDRGVASECHRERSSPTKCTRFGCWEERNCAQLCESAPVTGNETDGTHDERRRTESLDRSASTNSFFVAFQLTCTVKNTNKKRTIPVIVRLADVNDNAPQFVNTPYETSVSEVSRQLLCGRTRTGCTRSRAALPSPIMQRSRTGGSRLDPAQPRLLNPRRKLEKPITV